MTQDYDDYWIRRGLPEARQEEMHRWLSKARVASIGGGDPARRAVAAFLAGEDPTTVDLGEGVTYSADVTPAQRLALESAERRFPGFVNMLYTNNVIHGEGVMGLAPRGHNVSMADVSTVLLQLHKLGVVEPVAFRPSHSSAAFLGLTPANHGPQAEPNAATAAHWTWTPTADFTNALRRSTQ